MDLKYIILELPSKEVTLHMQ